MIHTLIWLVNLIVQLVAIVIIVQVFLSYFLAPHHPLRRSIDRIVVPILQVIRRYIPPLGPFDLSPLIVLILVQLAGRIIVSLLALLTT